MLAFHLILLIALWYVVDSRCPCYKPSQEAVELKVVSPRPHSYLKAQDLPARWDWRDVNGTNYCTRVMTQQNPTVCGSCWVEAATGRLSLIASHTMR